MRNFKSHIHLNEGIFDKLKNIVKNIKTKAEIISIKKQISDLDREAFFSGMIPASVASASKRGDVSNKVFEIIQKDFELWYKQSYLPRLKQLQKDLEKKEKELN